MPSATVAAPSVIGLQGLPDLLPSDEANLADHLPPEGYLSDPEERRKLLGGPLDRELGRDHLSHSSIGTFLNCGQKFDFSYERRLSLISTPAPLRLGRAFQAAIVAEDPQHGMQMVLDDRQVFDQRAGSEAQIEAMIVAAASRYYLDRYGPPGGEGEYPYRVRLRSPWTGAYSRTFDLLGYADEFNPDGADGPELIENKLVGKMDPKTIQGLALDRQIALSCYGIWRATGLVVRKVRYRWTKKPSIRQKQSETLEQFLDRLQADYANPERLDFYGHEEVLWRTTEDLGRIEAELWDWAEQLRNARKRRLWARDTSRCAEYGGCAFLPICAGDPDALHLYREKPVDELSLKLEVKKANEEEDDDATRATE